MAVYVIAVLLCGMDDGSGHDYGNDDEHLSLSTVLCLFNAILGTLVHLHPNKCVYLPMWAMGEVEKMY